MFDLFLFIDKAITNKKNDHYTNSKFLPVDISSILSDTKTTFVVSDRVFSLAIRASTPSLNIGDGPDIKLVGYPALVLGRIPDNRFIKLWYFEIGMHLESKIDNLICFRHLFGQTKAKKNVFRRAQRVL